MINPSALILEREIAKYISLGFHVVSRTDTSAQLVKPKEFSGCIAIVGFLFFAIGFFIYLLLYMAAKDQTVYIEVDPYGQVRVMSAGYAQQQHGAPYQNYGTPAPGYPGAPYLSLPNRRANNTASYSAQPKELHGVSGATISLLIAVICFIAVETNYGLGILSTYALKGGGNNGTSNTLINIASDNSSLLSEGGRVILIAVAVILILCLLQSILFTLRHRSAYNPMSALLFGLLTTTLIGFSCLLILPAIYGMVNSRLVSGQPLF
jgi:hypothetical protein